MHRASEDLFEEGARGVLSRVWTKIFVNKGLTLRDARCIMQAMSMLENNRLLQTRVTPLVDERVKRLAAASGASVATWLRQLVFREVSFALAAGGPLTRREVDDDTPRQRRRRT